jgi:MoxR-like ATPase
MNVPIDYKLDSVEAVTEGLISVGYIPNRKISTAVFLAERLTKPILVEGPAGVGKTELAKAISSYLKLPLIRLQCYEGLDEGKALYEWKYGKQLLYTQILKDKLGEEMRSAANLKEALARLDAIDDIFFSERFLDERPLLKALRHPGCAVLLIDEVDKADQEFEAFLLEILSDFQVTVPELGTISAVIPPIVFLTSNSTRDMGDALKRRCLHLHIGFPEPKLERRIVEVRVPGVGDRLLHQLVSFVQQIRGLDIKKLPSVSETIDWARVLVLLHADSLEYNMVHDTLNVLMKFEEDIETVGTQVPAFVHQALRESEAGH